MKIVFFGTPEFAVPSLEAIAASRHRIVAAVAQPDRPAGRGMKLRTPAVAHRARELGIPLLQPEKIRTPEFLSRIRLLEPDLGVVVAYGKILPATLLEIPPLGFVNVHGSILPKYRGAAPIQRAIEKGEVEVGASIMRVDEQLDHGSILSMVTTRVNPDEHAPAVADRLAGLGGKALLEVIERLADGPIAGQEQDHEAATYAAKIERHEGRIDWRMPARAIYNRFRAFDPWPGVFFDIGGETLKVREMRPASAEATARPGEIVALDGTRAIVAAGEEALMLLSLQRPGKPVANAADVLRGLHLDIGDVLA